MEIRIKRLTRGPFQVERGVVSLVISLANDELTGQLVTPLTYKFLDIFPLISQKTVMVSIVTFRTPFRVLSTSVMGNLGERARSSSHE